MIRPATAADAAAVHELTQAAFAPQAALDPPPGALGEPVDAVAADLAAHGGLVALDQGRIVAALRYRREEPVRWIRRVAVHPAAQRRGVGAALVTAAVAAATEAGDTAVRAGVRRALPGNLAFYAGLGFVPIAGDDRRVVLGRPLPRVVATAEDMRELGARLARLLRAGDLVLLSGPLGAGKTTLTQGIAVGLGVTDPVTSPTFVLSRRHRGAGLDLVHADAFRLAGRAEIDDLDLDSELTDAVLVVEWGEGLAEPLADGRLAIRLVPTAGPAGSDAPEPRLVTLAGVGPGWAGRQAELDTQV